MQSREFISNKSSPYRNDCTVRALASTTGIDYFVVFTALAAEGRRPNTGFNIEGWLKRNANEVWGFEFRPVTGPFGPGRFLLWNNRHAWAIVEGKLLDKWPNRCRPTACFEVRAKSEPKNLASLEALAKAKAKAEILFGD